MNETDKFADALLNWIKHLLTSLGMSSHLTDQLDAVIYIFAILIIAFAVGNTIHLVIAFLIKKILKYRKVEFLSGLIRYRALRKISWIVPPLIVSVLLPFAFSDSPKLLALSEKLTWIYFTVVLSISIDVVLSSVGDVLMSKGKIQDRPMRGLIQIIQVIVALMAVVVVVSILINKSPFNLITGLGAFAAVLMLVFKDSILGFVAGVLLSQNDMIHIGDWIEMPENSVNGLVLDMTLSTVKVQNFDNTTVTVPPYSLISGSFINWRGMKESGGRRIMRSYTINLNYIQTCTPEYLEEMKKIPLLTDYIMEKQKEQAEGKIVNAGDATSGVINGTIDTNLGLFRAYMTIYLQHHPAINQDLLLMVRTLDPTPQGLPLQVYCFSANKDWASYESIQAEVMEHFVSMLPKFNLLPFQRLYGKLWRTKESSS